MSRLSEAVLAKKLNTRHLARRELTAFDMLYQEELTKSTLQPDLDSLSEYVFEAKFTVAHRVSNREIRQHPEVIDVLLGHVKKQIIEAVFGEFRPVLNKLFIASYSQDMFEVQKQIQELERQMFE